MQPEFCVDVTGSGIKAELVKPVSQNANSSSFNGFEANSQTAKGTLACPLLRNPG
jgi:hypothetical protein